MQGHERRNRANNRVDSGAGRISVQRIVRAAAPSGEHGDQLFMCAHYSVGSGKYMPTMSWAAALEKMLRQKPRELPH